MSEDDGGGFSGFLFFVFIVQTIAVPLTASLFGTLLVEGYDAATGAHGGIFVALVCYAAVGLAEGYFIQTASGCADRSGGCFVWAPVVCVIVIGVLRDGRGVGAAVRELLAWNPYSIQGLASALLTMPAWASCWYSAGIVLANRSGRKSDIVSQS